MVELEEKEGFVDPSPTPEPIQPIETEADDTTLSIDDATIHELISNNPVEHDDTIPAGNPVNDETSTVTQPVVQKTVRVIRRTILQNGREISVEEQIEEELPNSGVPNNSTESDKVQSNRRMTTGRFQIPSPFGIVEEPIFPDERDTLSDKNGSVEITDITDEYNQDATSSSLNTVADPVVNQVVEIHEVIDDHQIIEQSGPAQVVEVIGSITDDEALQSQASQERAVFETLYENDEDQETDKEAEESQVTPELDDGIRSADDGQEAKLETDNCQLAEFQPKPELSLEDPTEVNKGTDQEAITSTGSETETPRNELEALPNQEPIDTQSVVQMQQEPEGIIQQLVQTDSELEPEKEEGAVEVEPKIEAEPEIIPDVECQIEIQVTTTTESIPEIQEEPNDKSRQVAIDELTPELVELSQENQLKVLLDPKVEIQQLQVSQPQIKLDEVITKESSTIMDQPQDDKDKLKPSMSDESGESDVENMDWNVCPDDERQFDEYFKDDRPSSSSSDSSTSTDITHLESVSGELPEESDSRVVDTTDSPSVTPLEEDASSPETTNFVEEKEPEIQNVQESIEENPADITDDAELQIEKIKDGESEESESNDEKAINDQMESQAPQLEDESAKEEIEETIPDIVVDDDLQQLMEENNLSVTERVSTPIEVQVKISTNLAEQLSQKLVEEALKTVEAVPVIQRLLSEELIQSIPEQVVYPMSEESSSSESEFSSSDEESESVHQKENLEISKDVVSDPNELIQSTPKTDDDILEQIIQQQSDPIEQILEVSPVESEKLEVQTVQSLPEEVVHSESESMQITLPVSEIKPTNLENQIVQSEADEDLLQISVSSTTETSTNVTLVQVGLEEKSLTESPEDFEPVVQIGEKVIDVLPDIVDQLVNMETLMDKDESDSPIERCQSQEEELSKERGDAMNTLIEHREAVAPTLGENTTGPPIDDSQIVEQVARLVSDRAAMMSQEAEQAELNTEWLEIEDLLSNRLDQLRATSSTHTSSVRYLATVTKVTVDESVEERKIKLNDNLAALKTAVQRREVVVIQRIVITIVRTVTEWLETIEYRVYTIKQTKSMERRTEQIQSLCEEVRIVEESLKTLEEVTEMAVEVVNEETKVLLHKCVKSLQQQMQSVSEVTKRSEGEIEHIRRQWQEYLDQITNEEDRIRDLINQLKLLQSAKQQSSQEKLVELEDIETAVQERLEGVTQLLHSGHDLVKETPFYQMPENAYSLLDTIKTIEESVRNERDILLHKAALTAEYRQTLQEFAEIVRLSDTLAASKLAARNPPEASLELEKRQRFLFCLSHFLQVLAALEPHLDMDTRALCQDLHAELVVEAGAILDRAVNRQEIVEMALTSWEHLEHQWHQEDEWFRELQIPDTSNVTSESFPVLTETLKVSQLFLMFPVYL